jgi:pimeloyl-ACP methyl ester carboxylesterase
MKRSFTLAISLIFILIGCSSDQSSSKKDSFISLTDFYQQELDWARCGFYECAKLLVPIDYQNLSTGVFELALTRDAADQPNNKIGSLVVNPGGPGGSGIDFAQGGERTASSEILNRFDIIGFDPRGVGKSDPITCLTDAETDEFLSADETPDTAIEIDAWNNWVDRFAEECQQKNPNTWQHIGSWNVARDMDVLRSALGEEKLNLLGKSYGTLLGGLYAQLFPERVGRFVLDGAVDPDVDFDQNLIQISSFELALNRFIDFCLTARNCPLSGTREQAYQQLIEFIDELDRSPIPTSTDRFLTESHATTAILIGLYDDTELWPFLIEALAPAFQGDGDYLLFLSDLANNRGDDGKYLDNSLAALYAVNCVDYADALLPTQLQEEVDRLTQASRFFAPLFGWGSSACLGWQGKNLETVGRLSAQTSQPILIIGTTYDPATPVSWSYSLSEQIANSVVLEWQGDGHTAYRRGSNCVDEIVDRYLFAGIMPENGQICPAINQR